MAQSDKIALTHQPQDVGALFAHDDNTDYICSIENDLYSLDFALVYVHEGVDPPDANSGIDTYGGKTTIDNRIRLSWNGVDKIYMWSSKPVNINFRLA